VGRHRRGWTTTTTTTTTTTDLASDGAAVLRRFASDGAAVLCRSALGVDTDRGGLT
jgi:hypothetical protein